MGAAARDTRRADEAIIELRHVTLAYDDAVALDDISLSVRAGERLCVLGANGSGKSTLASVIAGLVAPDAGTVRLVGQTVRTDERGVDFGAYATARRKVGLVFQNPDDQIVTTIVADDIAFGPENLGVAAADIGPRVGRELRRVAMDAYADANPSNLSGGQKQRVAIAGALAMEPPVLVLDEPGALLDVRGRRGILRVMGELAATGTTIVHVTHFMDEALAADRVIVLDRGRIVLAGTPDAVFAQGSQLADLGLELPFAARVSTALRAAGLRVPFACKTDDLVRSLTVGATLPDRADAAEGCPLARTPRPRAATPGNAAGGQPADDAHPTMGSHAANPIVSVRDVAYSYADGREHRALAGVSFAVRQGARVAIVGHTGSGKSTLLRLLCGLEAPDAGTVTVGGICTSRRRERRRLRGRVGFVMQHPERQLFAETVADDVAFGPRNLGLSASEANARVDEALSLVNLADRRAASPFQLSGGQQRLCAIAGVLAMHPRLLVLDEPTAGLDPCGRSQLRAVLEDVHAAGATIIEVTHSMDDAARADQVVVLANGGVLASGAPSEVFVADAAERLRAHGLGLPAALACAGDLESAGFPALGAPLTTEDLVGAVARQTLGVGAGGRASVAEGA